MKSDFGGYLKLFGLKTQAAGNSISAYAFRKKSKKIYIF